MECKRCKHPETMKAGQVRGLQRYACKGMYARAVDIILH